MIRRAERLLFGTDYLRPGQPVPQFVKAMNTAVQHAYASQADFDTAPTASLPHGPSTEFQVTSPIVGTVDLTNDRYERSAT